MAGSSPLSAQTTTTLTVDVNGTTRSYVLYVPASYTPGTAVPLLFNFHGYTSNATEQMNYGDFRPIADAEGFLIAHPQGSDLQTTSSNDPHWNVGGWTVGSNADDLGFTDAMITAISNAYTIDASRIYSTGFSNGGFFSFELACKRSGVIAAIGSVAGTITPEQETAGCTPTRAVPVVQIHGTSDPTIPYNGSFSYAESVDDAVNVWRGYNGASVAIAPVAINPNSSDGTTVDHFRYETPAGASLVEHYRVNSGTHQWPGSAFNRPGTSYDIDAAQVVWDFVSQFSLPAALPATLTHFGAQQKNNTVRVAWTTSHEVGVKEYVIERRGALGDWDKIGHVAANNRPGTYGWTDAQPLPGQNYYRLKTIDLDGTTTVSEVVEVNMGESSAELSVFPNPVRETLNVARQSDAPAPYRIFDLLGREVARGQLQGTVTTIVVEELSAGTYRLVAADQTHLLVVE